MEWVMFDFQSSMSRVSLVSILGRESRIQVAEGLHLNSWEELGHDEAHVGGRRATQEVVGGFLGGVVTSIDISNRFDRHVSSHVWKMLYHVKMCA